MTRRSRRRRRSVVSIPPLVTLALPALVTAAVVLGGASAAGTLPNLALQLLSIGAVWAVALSPGTQVSTVAERGLLGLGIGFFVIAIVQLIPVSAALWTALPGRLPVAHAFALLGTAPPVLSLSLDWHATLGGTMPLCVAAGVYALARRADDGTINGFAWTVGIVAGISVLVGMLQLVGGERSPFYLYAVTNRGQPVGFFSNSNHLATLVLMAVPMVAGLAAQRRFNRSPGALLVVAALGALLLFGLVTDGSLAGLCLLVPTAIACLLLFRSGRSRKVALLALGIGVLLVAAFVLLALNSPLISGFASTSLEGGPMSRLGFARNGWAALVSYFPAGSGLGTFKSVYPAFEDPRLVTDVFVNHAHNDYLEFVIETGLPGLVLILAFLGWWIWRTIAIWKQPASGALTRAATIATGIVILHSAVDYPIRTSAILAIFVACCTIMARSSGVVSLPALDPDEDVEARHVSA